MPVYACSLPHRHVSCYAEKGFTQYITFGKPADAFVCPTCGRELADGLSFLLGATLLSGESLPSTEIAEIEPACSGAEKG